MSPPSSRRYGTLAIAVIAALPACTHTIKVDPIRVEPIDITLHIYLEADKKLDSFFGDDAHPAAPPPAPAPKPEGASS